MPDLRDVLARHARSFYEQGWMVGTSGNLSAREPDGSFWITASGVDKGLLQREQFLRLTVDGQVVEQPEGTRPSAETSIHQAVYTLFPEAMACYHVHTVHANLVCRLDPEDSIRLPALEMVKGLGVWEQEPEVDVAVFFNHLDVPRISAELLERFAVESPQVPGMLIRDHGLTVWAPTPQKALQRVELFEYLFRFMVLQHGA